MMAASDTPAAGGAAIASAAVEASANRDSNDENMRQVWRFIYADMAFIKSLYGIFIATEMGLSLLGLICVSVPKNEGCAYLYSGSYSYFEFVSNSCFIISLIWYILYVLAITRKLGFVRWDIGEIVWLGFFILNYFISSCVIAANACHQGGYTAAAVFGFMCFATLCAHEVFDVRTFLEKRRSSSSGGNTAEAADEDSKY